MLTEEHGNLLEAPAEALVNTVNTVGVMGKGLALQFKQAYPADFRAYESACRHGEVRLGKMFTYEPGQLGEPRFVINFPTKWRHSVISRVSMSWCTRRRARPRRIRCRSVRGGRGCQQGVRPC